MKVINADGVVIFFLFGPRTLVLWEVQCIGFIRNQKLPTRLSDFLTLNGRLPLEDSSVFDDSVCVLIVMT